MSQYCASKFLQTTNLKLSSTGNTSKEDYLKCLLSVIFLNIEERSDEKYIHENENSYPGNYNLNIMI